LKILTSKLREKLQDKNTKTKHSRSRKQLFITKIIHVQQAQYQ